MVATLLKLRFRVLGNQLARSPWQLVGFLFGALWGVGVLGLAVLGLVFLGFQGVEFATPFLIGAGSALVLGWILGPIIAFGIDTTLDPAKLVVFPMTTGRMMWAMVLAGVTGVPGIIASVAALATFAVWLHSPAAAIVAVFSIPLGVLLCVVASRTVASLSSGFSSGRRFQEAAGIIVFIPIILAGPILGGAVALLATAGDGLFVFLRVLSWTPLGAPWAAPADAASGDWLPAIAKVLIAAATIAVLVLLWRWSLVTSLENPKQVSSSGVKAGKIGWFGRFPATPAGAITARALTFWLRDPRYLRQLIIVPLMPVILLLYSRGGNADLVFTFTAPVIALVLGIAIYTDISYDGTAYGSQLATRATGRDDRIGRVTAAALVGLPLTVLAAVLAAAFTNGWQHLPAALGVSLGLLLTCYGVCAVSSAQFVIPVAAPGDSPFKRVPGTTFTMGLAFMGIWLVGIGLSLPEIVLGAIAIFGGSILFGWISLAVGVVLGVVFLLVGIHVGGRMLDRNGPVLLSRLKAMKNA